MLPRPRRGKREQRVGEVGHVLKAPGRVFLEAQVDDALQRRFRFGAALGERRRRGLQDALQQCRQAVRAAVRAAPRHQLVQDGAERPDIRSLVDVLDREDLLGRHVLRGSHQTRGLLARQLATEQLPGERRFGDAEVEQLDQLQTTLPREEQVLRFDVPVNDPFCVRRSQRLARLQDIVDRTPERDTAFEVQHGSQITTFQVLHHDVRSELVVRAHVEHLCDVLTPDHDRRLRLARETRHDPRQGQHLWSDGFDGNARVELDVACCQDHAHRPHSDQMLDAKAPRQHAADGVLLGTEAARAGGRRAVVSFRGSLGAAQPPPCRGI
jgi:hypothetical protein